MYCHKFSIKQYKLVHIQVRKWCRFLVQDTSKVCAQKTRRKCRRIHVWIIIPDFFIMCLEDNIFVNWRCSYFSEHFSSQSNCYMVCFPHHDVEEKQVFTDATTRDLLFPLTLPASMQLGHMKKLVIVINLSLLMVIMLCNFAVPSWSLSVVGTYITMCSSIMRIMSDSK